MKKLTKIGKARISRPEVIYKRGVLKNFIAFTGSLQYKCNKIKFFQNNNYPFKKAMHRGKSVQKQPSEVFC